MRKPMERLDERLHTMLCAQLNEYYQVGSHYEIQLLKYSENYNWLVTTESSRYVLRVCRQGYHKRDELLGELLWLKELKETTDIKMPEIIPNKEGHLLSQIGGYDCTMFSFLKGETLRYIQGDRLLYYLKEIGQIAAKLHNQVQGYHGEKKFSRFTWDLEDLLGETSRVGDWKDNPFLVQGEVKEYEKAIAIIERKLQEYGKTKQNFGLIHSDLNINNVLVYDTVVQIIDFDDCGYGWFLYDLSTSVLEYDDGIQEKINAWLEGYQRERILSEKDIAMIPTFVILRKIVRLGWIASHIENDTVKKVTDRYYRETFKMAMNYIKSNGRKI